MPSPRWSTSCAGISTKAASMSQPLRLRGTPASPGYATGPVFDLDSSAKAYAAKGLPEAEIGALDAAIAIAVARLAAMMAAAKDEAAAMLEFQIAMLEDGALAAAAHDEIARGDTAALAWGRALDAEISGYEASDDDYFRARSADLRDIRDQVLRALVGEEVSAAPAGAILTGADIAPTRFLATDWSGGGGIALRSGSAASHVAMLARARGVPMVVGLGNAAASIAGPALLDAEQGVLTVNPSAADGLAFQDSAAAFAARLRATQDHIARPAATADGTPIRVLVNVADPADVDLIDIAHCDGVGLMRTEFLFGKASGLPDEATQYAAYCNVLDWAEGKPVTIRTVDAGGDKPVAGFTVAEGNPFLGLRGIRLSLARPEVFRVQVRALLRAATRGNLKVMLPMVAVPDELERARAIFHEEAAALATEGVDHAIPPLGIMVEVPAAALAPEAFASAAFFSIGSNDLTQYVMAAARDNGAVAALNDARNPAVVRLVREVAAHGAATARPVSLCGDAGGDPAVIPLLLAAGVRELSVAHVQLGGTKAVIAACRLG
jgi:phosphotransferase system enzyme I (PtsI)